LKYGKKLNYELGILQLNATQSLHFELKNSKKRRTTQIKGSRHKKEPKEKNSFNLFALFFKKSSGKLLISFFSL